MVRIIHGHCAARQTKQRLLADMEKVHGPDHCDVAASPNNLALFMDVRGDAEPSYTRALTILEKIHGLDAAEIAPELNNLAVLCQRQMHSMRYRDAGWLINRHAVDVRPSVTRLKALRAVAHHDQGIKPMIGIGDPLLAAAR